MEKSKKAIVNSRQLRISNYAFDEINNIVSYIAEIKKQPLNALKVSKSIEDAIIKISVNPFAYKECAEIPTKTRMYRKAVCLSWLIIYKITNYEILVLSIIHGARNPLLIQNFKKIK